MQALGAAVVEETEMGEYRNLIIEATDGKCAMMAVPGSQGDILLTAIADSKLVFGIFLVLCKNTCRVMGERLATTRY
jgi:predicted regulator of Ras-like GTPase activity (Roadblock/LC7/MglB family)